MRPLPPPEGEPVLGERGGSVEIGQVGAHDQRGGRIAGSPPQTALGQRRTDQGMAEVVHGRILTRALEMDGTGGMP